MIPFSASSDYVFGFLFTLCCLLQIMTPGGERIFFFRTTHSPRQADQERSYPAMLCATKEIVVMAQQSNHEEA